MHNVTALYHLIALVYFTYFENEILYEDTKKKENGKINGYRGEMTIDQRVVSVLLIGNKLQISF